MSDEEISSKPKESKHDKFKRIATKRVENAANQIRLIGNLSSRVNYVYTAEDVEQITSYLKKCLEDMEARFNTRKEDTSSFSFHE
ncbi:MAG: hypothetical protein ACI4NA_00405 [Succinivibrio sp.]